MADEKESATPSTSGAAPRPDALPQTGSSPTTMSGASPGGPDLSRIRLSQDFGAILGVKKQLITVPVKKPDKQSFFRVHPDPDWQLQAAVLELKEERETYVVDPALLDAVGTEAAPRLIVPAVTRQGVTFLWPLRLPAADGRQDEWARSAMEAATIAREQWVRMTANMSLGAYEVLSAPISAAPVWPDATFEELVKIAFKNHYINDLDHPVLRRLRGEL